MKNDTSSGSPQGEPVSPTDKPTSEQGPTRRRFLSQVSAALAGGAILGKTAIASAQSENPGLVIGDPALPGHSDPRVRESFALRRATAIAEAKISVPRHTTNGDEERYPDKSGTYSKGLLQDRIGVVNPQAYQSFRHALNTGRFADFENIIIGGTRTLNGPMGSYAFSLEGTDDAQFGNAPSPANQISQVVVPPAPALASEEYGTELIELYWASLLRDIPFVDYASHPTAVAATQELSSMPTYAGPRDSNGHVTPDLLFRGSYPGETVGPYVSQFMITPTSFGAQPLSQKLTTYINGSDFMTDRVTFQQVQNGIDTGLSAQIDPVPRFLSNGRDMGAYTRVDVLFQAYFVAFLALSTMRVPRNPGNPYVGSRTQNGFGTFGGPDFAATTTAVARPALNSVWYQKWLVHLRHRPESGGAIVRQILRGHGHTLMGRVNDNVLNSQAVQSSFNKIWRLLPGDGLSRRLAHPSRLSDRTWHSRGRLYYRPQVFLRRRFCHS